MATSPTPPPFRYDDTHLSVTDLARRFNTTPASIHRWRLKTRPRLPMAKAGRGFVTTPAIVEWWMQRRADVARGVADEPEQQAQPEPQPGPSFDELDRQCESEGL